MKTESIIWYKNFEIYQYKNETFGEVTLLENGDTREQAQSFAEKNSLQRLHSKYPHLIEIYPLPCEKKIAPPPAIIPQEIPVIQVEKQAESEIPLHVQIMECNDDELDSFKIISKGGYQARAAYQMRVERLSEK